MMECHLQTDRLLKSFERIWSKKMKPKDHEVLQFSTILKGEIYLYLNDALKVHKWI